MCKTAVLTDSLTVYKEQKQTIAALVPLSHQERVIFYEGLLKSGKKLTLAQQAGFEDAEHGLRIEKLML